MLRRRQRDKRDGILGAMCTPLRHAASHGIACVLVVAASAQTVCVPVDFQPDDPFHYAQALVEGLSYASAGLESRDNALKEYRESKDVFEGLTALMYGIKAEQKDLSCAARMLKGPQKSTNKFISDGAAIVAMAYLGLIVNGNTEVDLIKATINDAASEDDIGLGDFLEKVADISLKRNESWKLFAQCATAAARWGLLDYPDGPNALPRGLALTRDQRQTLIRRLEKEFGTSIRKGPQAGQSSLEVTAAVLHQFLSDQKWKSRDDVPH